MHRRTLLVWLGASGIVPGCISEPSVETPETQLPPRDDVDWPDAPSEPLDDVEDASVKNVEALMSVFIPTERDAGGEIVAAGALEAGAMQMLELPGFSRRRGRSR